jgi:hypothetical protein
MSAVIVARTNRSRPTCSGRASATCCWNCSLLTLRDELLLRGALSDFGTWG